MTYNYFFQKGQEMKKVIVISTVTISLLFGLTGLQAAEPESIQAEPRMKQSTGQTTEPKNIQTEPRMKQMESGKIPNKPGEDISATPITLP